MPVTRLRGEGARLARYADAIASSDSAAWSYRGRFVAGCSSSHRSESNCLRFALSWHTKLLASLRTEVSDQDDGCRPRSRPAFCRITEPRTGTPKNRPGSTRSVDAHRRRPANPSLRTSRVHRGTARPSHAANSQSAARSDENRKTTRTTTRLSGLVGDKLGTDRDGCGDACGQELDDRRSLPVGEPCPGAGHLDSEWAEELLADS